MRIRALKNSATVAKTIQCIHNNCMQKKLSPETTKVFEDSFFVFICKHKCTGVCHQKFNSPKSCPARKISFKLDGGGERHDKENVCKRQ